MAETVEDIFRGLEARFVPGVVDKEQTFYFSVEDHKYTVTITPDSAKVEEGKTDAGLYVPQDPDGAAATDYVLFTPRQERPDPCAKMRQGRP